MPIERVLLVAVAAASGAFAQPAEDGDAARGFETLEQFLSGVQSLTADFRQELWTADQRLLQTESGTFVLVRPNRFRWTYLEPTELIVVADGSQVWIYDVELAQVTVAPFDDSIGSSPAMLLSGGSNVREDFDVARTYELEGLEWVKLVPKSSGTDFASISIGFDGMAPKKLELVDGLNQITRIEFDNLVINPDVSESVFQLDLPPGVDVGGEG